MAKKTEKKIVPLDEIFKTVEKTISNNARADLSEYKRLVTLESHDEESGNRLIELATMYKKTATEMSADRSLLLQVARVENEIEALQAMNLDKVVTENHKKWSALKDAEQKAKEVQQAAERDYLLAKHRLESRENRNRELAQLKAKNPILFS